MNMPRPRQPDLYTISWEYNFIEHLMDDYVEPTGPNVFHVTNFDDFAFFIHPSTFHSATIQGLSIYAMMQLLNITIDRTYKETSVLLFRGKKKEVTGLIIRSISDNRRPPDYILKFPFLGVKFLYIMKKYEEAGAE